MSQRHASGRCRRFLRYAYPVTAAYLAVAVTIILIIMVFDL